MESWALWSQSALIHDANMIRDVLSVEMRNRIYVDTSMADAKIYPSGTQRISENALHLYGWIHRLDLSARERQRKGALVLGDIPIAHDHKSATAQARASRSCARRRFLVSERAFGHLPLACCLACSFTFVHRPHFLHCQACSKEIVRMDVLPL